MDKLQNLLKRIKKLITQAEGERDVGNIQAAESFAVKAQELLSKHKLELTDLERIEEDEKNPLTYEMITPDLWGDSEQKSRVEHTEDLAACIAKAYYCRILAVLETNNLIIVGRQADINITKAILANVMRAGIVNCELELAKATLRISEIEGAATHWGKTGGNKEFRFSFFSGFNQRINARLEKAFNIIQENAAGSQALVKASKEVDEFVDKLDPVRDEPLPYRAVLMETAYYRGMDYGSSVNIFPNVFDSKGEGKKQIGD